MQTTHILYPLLGVVLGAASAGVTVSMLADQDPPTGAGETSGLSVVPAGPSAADLLTRVQSLQDENQSLRDRLTSLELRPPAAQRVPAQEGVSKAEFEEFKNEVLGRLKAARPDVAEPEQMKAQVADAVREFRKEEKFESVRQAQVKRVDMLEDRLARLSSRLGLDNVQVNQMRVAFTEQFDRDQELIRLWEAGTDPGLLGETKQANALEHRAAFEGILTPTQFDTYRRSGGKGD